MEVVIYLLWLLLNVLVSALPATDTKDLSTINSEKSLSARQIITQGTYVQCCTNCAGRYDYATFWHTFDDLCTWAGNGLELWTSQTYYTGSYYCPDLSSACIHLEIQYLCGSTDGGGMAAAVSYDGCMGFFGYLIWPLETCGGPPFPGGQVHSADSCWIFQATADVSAQWVNKMELIGIECDETGHWCTRPGSNQTVDTYAGPEHQFGSLVQS